MTLKFRYEIEINKPLRQVTDLFANRNQLTNWQHGLVKSELLAGNDGQLKYKLTFDLGRRKMFMTETIVRDDMPEHYDQLYEMKGVQHSVKNSFYPNGANKTRWISEVEFTFSGLKRLIAGWMKSGFEEQTSMLMKSFKVFAERSFETR